MRLIVGVLICLSFLPGAVAATKEGPLPAAVIEAKSVFIQNDTDDPDVLTAAQKEFAKWGRFSFAAAKDKADLVIVFAHKDGVDRWGNMGLTLMDVYVKGMAEPAFHTGAGLHVVWDKQRRTKVCIEEFADRIERKP